MDTASGNIIYDKSSYSVAQQPFLPKSFFQKMKEYFTQPTSVNTQPDVNVIQEGEILHVLINKGREGQTNVKIKIPSNSILQHITRTQNITELKVLFGDILSRTKNHENANNRNISKKSDLQSANESCSSRIDDSNFQASNIPPCLENTFSDTENGYSNEEHYDENKTLYHRGFPVELVSYSSKIFHFNGSSSLLESVTFIKENRSRKRETLFLFHMKGVLYSPCALVHLDIEDIEKTNFIDILCISETESEVRVEVLTGLSRYTAFQFAKLLQLLNNGQRVRKLKDLIPCIQLEIQKIDDLEFPERVKTENEGFIKTCYSLNQDLYGKQSISSKIKDIEDTLAEIIKRLQQEINKIQQDIHFNMDTTKDKIDGKSSNTKFSTYSRWTDRTKLVNSKVRTQSDRPTWKICLYNREDETEGVLSEYLGDPLIGQSIYEFFGQYIDCGYKGSFEGPHITWPSMHPLLPYKCRYLDNRGS
ncbi:uncharacterized protein LOC127724420 isoform X2 [Mytilus californianus]|uniref:uncharacterized protein LOC127724420 isoform X2 n=1 Tax=Mytilus californianus TaxID=6549 RepID=UPI002246BD86|nr:uncharacterized protein LOC127724420 isoform X2 [Mytilus californianus]